MKKLLRIFTLVTILSILLSSVSSVAFARQSGQISAYSIDAISPSSGRLAIQFSVIGAGKVDELGAKSIYIYERSGESWIFKQGFFRGDEGTTRSDTTNYTNTLYYDGKPETEHRIIVTIFAENEDGMDTRSKTLYVTTK